MMLVKKHHPDTGGNDQDMRWINAAYDVLKLNAQDEPEVELKPEDQVVIIEFQTPQKEPIDSGQCNHSEFMEMIQKIDEEGVGIYFYPKTNFYDNANDKWLVNTIVIYIESDDFHTIFPYIEPFFKH